MTNFNRVGVGLAKACPADTLRAALAKSLRSLGQPWLILHQLHSIRHSFPRDWWKSLGKRLWGICGKVGWKSVVGRKSRGFWGKSGVCTQFLHGDLHGFYTWIMSGFISVLYGVLHGFHIAYYYYY